MIAEADGSTLFLDEISDMPADLQTVFCGCLQEREYRPLGSTRMLKADFRLIAATNRPIRSSPGRKSVALGFVLSAKHISNCGPAVARAKAGYSTFGSIVSLNNLPSAWKT
jgi:sigma54-dependent transcription regulator